MNGIVSIEPAGDVHGLAGLEAAFMTAIEGIPLRLNPSEQGLEATATPGSAVGIRRLFKIEDGPIVRIEGRRGGGLGSRNLYEMADVADGKPGSMAGAGIVHVDCDRLTDTAASDRRAE